MMLVKLKWDIVHMSCGKDNQEQMSSWLGGNICG